MQEINFNEIDREMSASDLDWFDDDWTNDDEELEDYYE